ncbi:MAG: MFS transporter, partial [Hyphomonadaceae bacterium]
MLEAERSPAAPTSGPKALSIAELVALTAALSALNAMSIDVMLPALSDISNEYALAQANDRQIVVIVYVMCFGLAQLVYGPLTDAFGRRPVLLGALGLYAAATLLAVIAPTFSLL